MKSILLIGLGRFGKHIAMKLRDLNHQVMAVDQGRTGAGSFALCYQRPDR